MNSEGGAPTEERPKESDTLFAILLFPIRFFWKMLQILLVLTIVAPFLLVGLAFLFIVVDTGVWLFDLIFRLNTRSSLQGWLSSRIRPFFENISDAVAQWVDALGLALLFTELVRGLVLFLIFVFAGFAVFHLRIVHRATYALLELAVAIVAMWIAIDGMAGGDFSLKYVIALLSGLYIMVRGLQNFDEGLQQAAAKEASLGKSDGPESRRSKILIFKSNGEIGEGRNDNEFRWRAVSGRLEILNSKNEIYSRFVLSAGDRFIHTNEEVLPSIKGQTLEPIQFEARAL